MTLDEIIEYFEKTGALGPKGYGLAELQLRTAALLKAGKAMRYANYDWDAYEDGCKAWDAAMKEDV